MFAWLGLAALALAVSIFVISNRGPAVRLDNAVGH